MVGITVSVTGGSGFTGGLMSLPLQALNVSNAVKQMIQMVSGSNFTAGRERNRSFINQNCIIVLLLHNKSEKIFFTKKILLVGKDGGY